MRGIVPLAGIVLVAALPRLLDLDMRFSTPLRWPANYDGTVAAGCMVTIAIATLAAGWLAPPQYFQWPGPQAVAPEATVSL
jgi:hypothetical protein